MRPTTVGKLHALMFGGSIYLLCRPLFILDVQKKSASHKTKPSSAVHNRPVTTHSHTCAHNKQSSSIERDVKVVTPTHATPPAHTNTHTDTRQRTCVKKPETRNCTLFFYLSDHYMDKSTGERFSQHGKKTAKHVLLTPDFESLA